MLYYNILEFQKGKFFNFCKWHIIYFITTEKIPFLKYSIGGPLVTFKKVIILLFG